MTDFYSQPPSAIAQYWASRGYYVFPAKVWPKQDGKKGVAPIDDWDEVASNDPSKVAKMFAEPRWSDAAVCIACEPSRLVVADGDLDPVKGDGVSRLLALSPSAGLVVRTPSGGMHQYFLGDPGRPIGNTQSALAEGVDVRGVGGFVFAPGSRDWRGQYVIASPTIDPGPIPAGILARLDQIDTLRREQAEAAAAKLPAPGMASTRDAERAEKIIPTVAQAYADSDDERRTRGAYHTLIRLIGLANYDPGRLIGFAEGHWMAAVAASRLNRPGGLTDREAARQWQKIVAEKADHLEPLGPDPYAMEVMPLPLSPYWTVPTMVTMDDPAPGPPVDEATERAIAAEAQKIHLREQGKLRYEQLKGGGPEVRKERLRAALFDATNISTRPRLRPIVPGTLYFNSLARTNGESGAGKSLVTLDKVARIAAGMSWAGRQTVPTRVLYIAAEGAEGMVGRVAAWEKQNGRRMQGVTILDMGVQILGPDWMLLPEVWGDDTPGLIILDTQSRMTAGVPENDNAEGSRIVQALDAMRERTGACIELVHHTPRGGSEGRGATAIKGALHSETLIVKRGRLIEMTMTKNKDADDGGRDQFSLTPVSQPDVYDIGSSVNTPAFDSAVAVWMDPNLMPVLGDGITEKDRRTIGLYLSAVELFNPGDGGSRDDFRREFSRLPILHGKGKDTVARYFHMSWAHLIQLGLLAKLYGKERYRVVVGPGRTDSGMLAPNEMVGDGWKHDPPDEWEIVRTVQENGRS